MSVLRAAALYSQQRVDVSTLRLFDAGVQGDFDCLAGQIMSGRDPLVIRGATINPAGIGGPPTALQLDLSDTALLHYGATSSGTIFYTAESEPVQILSTTNPLIVGSFTANTVNYVGLDLVRIPDDTTADQVAFLIPNLDQEVYRETDTGQILQYRIYISTTLFGSSPNVCPVAQVAVDDRGNVTSIEDCRPMSFRLGSGGDSPSASNSYVWPSSTLRLVEPNISSTSTSNNPFVSADKSIYSQKAWQDAVMSRIWEIGGGSNWYSPSTGANDVVTAIGAGGGFTYVSPTLTWTGITVGFTNSNANYNTITNGTADLSATGSVLYILLDRSDTSPSTALVPAVCQWNNLYLQGSGTPGIPYALAWNFNGTVYARGDGNPVPIVLGGVATVSSGGTGTTGIVEIYNDPTSLYTNSGTSSTSTPIVPVMSGAHSGQILALGLTRPASGTIMIGANTYDTGVSIGQSGFGTSLTLTGALNHHNSVSSGVTWFQTDNVIGGYSDVFRGKAGNSTTNALIEVVGQTPGAQIKLENDSSTLLSLVGNTTAYPAAGTGTGATNTGSQINTGTSGPLVLVGGGVSTSGPGVILNTEAALVSGKAVSIRNFNTEIASIDYQGYITSAGNLIPPPGVGMCNYASAAVSVTNSQSHLWVGSVSANPVTPIGGVTISTTAGATNGALTIPATQGTYIITIGGTALFSSAANYTYSIYNMTVGSASFTGTVTLSSTATVVLSGAYVFQPLGISNTFIISLVAGLAGPYTVTSDSLFLMAQRVA